MADEHESTADVPRIQYRPLVASPELHQDWHDEQEDRSVTWPEAFFDLFFVAAISNLGHLFKEKPDAANAGRIVLYHAIMFFIWTDYATLKTRYRLKGLFFRCVGLMLQLGTIGFVIGVRDDALWYHLVAGGYGLARAATAILYGIIALTIPRARPLSLAHLALNSSMVAGAVCAAVFREDYHTFHWIFIVTAMAEAVMPAVPSTFLRRHDLPVHVEHMSERLGQLIMLHLGEAVIGFASSPLENTVPQFVAVALAAVLVWCLHLCYYHIMPDQHDHAYRQSRVRGLLFFYCHWPLAVAFLLTGTGLRLLLGTYPAADQPPAIGFQTAASAATMGSADSFSAVHRLLLLLPSAAHPILPQISSGSSSSSSLMGRSGSSSLMVYAAQEPAVTLDVSLLVCISYAASLHILAIIRAAHYFSLDPQHRIVRFQEQKGVKFWWNAWWCMLWIWPIPVYLTPLLIQQLGGANAANSPPSPAPASSSIPIALENAMRSHSAGLMQYAEQVSGVVQPGVVYASTSTATACEESTGGLSVTVLLALLAAHAVVLTLAESLFAHKITKTPVTKGLTWAGGQGSELEGREGEAAAPAGHEDLAEV